MLYTIDEQKKSVIFQLPLYDYLGKGYRFNHETKKRDSYWLNSLQNYEEDFFDNFQDYYYGYITDDQVDENKDEATATLLAKGYTQAEIDLFSDELNESIKRAMSDAWRSSYESEWLKKFYAMTQKQIDQDLADALPSTPYKLLDDITTQDYINDRFEADHIRLEIYMSEITLWLYNNGYVDLSSTDDYIDHFVDNALDYDRNPINTEHVDYYGTMGDCDDWLECFNDSQEVSYKINSYRKSEADKLNNYELASVNLKSSLQEIKDYTDKYLPNEPKATKIKRQIKALQSIIRN